MGLGNVKPLLVLWGCAYANFVSEFVFGGCSVRIRKHLVVSLLVKMSLNIDDSRTFFVISRVYHCDFFVSNFMLLLLAVVGISISSVWWEGNSCRTQTQYALACVYVIGIACASQYSCMLE